MRAEKKLHAIKNSELELTVSEASTTLLVASESLLQLAAWCASTRTPLSADIAYVEPGRVGEELAPSLVLWKRVETTNRVELGKGSAYVVFMSYKPPMLVETAKPFVRATVKYEAEAEISSLICYPGNAVFTEIRTSSGGRRVYEYPPRTAQTILFYLLNPEVEKIAYSVAKDRLSDELQFKVWRSLLLEVKPSSLPPLPPGVHGLAMVALAELDAVSPFAYISAYKLIAYKSSFEAKEILGVSVGIKTRELLEYEYTLTNYSPVSDRSTKMSSHLTNLLLLHISSVEVAEKLREVGEKVLRSASKTYRILQALTSINTSTSGLL